MKINWFKNGFKTSKMRIIMMVVYSLIIIAVTTCLIFFTSLREFIPGYTDATLDRRVYNMERRADSIEEVFHQKDLYIENLRRIINNEDMSGDTLVTSGYGADDSNLADNSLDVPLFFVPIKGMVTNHFNSYNKHFGVDVVSKTDAVIKATADGTVIFADWSYEGGYIIGIQHNSNLISVYKHNASLLCREGDMVKAGDAIAVLGGGGSTSTGPHLHFELWFKGMALNPEYYMSFEGK